MAQEKKILKKAHLYLVLDHEVSAGRDMAVIVDRAIKGGVDIIQLRDKHGDACRVLSLAKKLSLQVMKARNNGAQVLFIVNDRIDIAILSGADGVHVGQDDIPFLDARRLMGSDKIVGVSCQTFSQSQKAQDDGADYIGFGSVFKTQTKPDRCPMDLKLLAKVIRYIKIPLFAIGGITQKNLPLLTSMGINRVAVTRAISLKAQIQSSLDLRKILVNQ